MYIIFVISDLFISSFHCIIIIIVIYYYYYLLLLLLLSSSLLLIYDMIKILTLIPVVKVFFFQLDTKKEWI